MYRRRRRKTRKILTPRKTYEERLAIKVRQNAVIEKVEECFKKYFPQLVYVTSDWEFYVQYYGNNLIPTKIDTNPRQGMMFANMRIRKDNVDLTILPCLFLTDLMQKTPSLLKLTDRDIRIRFHSEDQVNVEEIDFLIQQGIEAWKQRGYIVETATTN